MAGKGVEGWKEGGEWRGMAGKDEIKSDIVNCKCSKLQIKKQVLINICKSPNLLKQKCCKMCQEILEQELLPSVGSC